MSQPFFNYKDQIKSWVFGILTTISIYAIVESVSGSVVAPKPVSINVKPKTVCCGKCGFQLR